MPGAANERKMERNERMGSKIMGNVTQRNKSQTQRNST